MLRGLRQKIDVVYPGAAGDAFVRIGAGFAGNTNLQAVSIGASGPGLIDEGPRLRAKNLIGNHRRRVGGVNGTETKLDTFVGGEVFGFDPAGETIRGGRLNDSQNIGNVEVRVVSAVK